MERKHSILTRREHYAADYSTVVRQRDNDTQTDLQIRRIRHDGKPEDELQIEITITKFGAKRNTTTHSSFVCPAPIADIIGKAMLEYNAADPFATQELREANRNKA